MSSGSDIKIAACIGKCKPPEAAMLLLSKTIIPHLGGLRLKTCLSCCHGCGDFCILYERHIDDSADRENCKGYDRIGTPTGMKFGRDIGYLYEGDNPALAKNIRKGNL